MPRWADNHTKAVTLLKLILPLIALAILSSLFVFSKTIDPEAAIPYATFDVEDRLREPKITDAAYVGVTQDGDQISITASVAVPTNELGGSAKQVQGKITSKIGTLTEVDAKFVDYDSQDSSAALTGGVDIRSTGYVMNTDALDVTLDRISATSRGVVTATGPLGTLRAGRMQITATKGGTRDYLLVFNSGVHLIYQPKN
jgi:lipopolysaccharide export system protein LptC